MVRVVGEATAYGCAFCRRRIPFDEPSQLPLVVPNGGREHRFWAHRDCFRRLVRPSLHAMVDQIPPARREDGLPPTGFAR
jgi:hypothetical protein